MITGQSGCGLRYAVRRSGSAVGYCALSIGCGTRDEAGYPGGIAHFTEHTIFKGTSRKSSTTINGYLDSLGGELNAYTTKEEIVIHATVLKEDLNKACSLLMELATCPVFPENEINTERSVIIDEILSYKDSPADDVYDHFEAELFKGHPLSPMILGTEESVSKITPDDLRRFVKEKFRPEIMAFTIVADIEESRLEKYVLRLSDRFFGKEVPESSDKEAVTRREISEVPANRFTISEEKDNHEVNAVIGGLAPSLHSGRERIATILLANILAGPASNSILSRILREKNGWVYGVESNYTQYSETGIFSISIGCDRSNIGKCMRAIKKEILKLQTLPLSEKRLNAAKKQLLGQLAIASDNGEAQCLSMGKSLLAYGRIEPDTSVRNKVESVTAEELRQIACKVLGADNLSSLTYL